MAVFRYDGEVQSIGVGNSFGPCVEIRLPRQGPGKEIHTPTGASFAPGVDTVTTTDPRAIRALQADTRFTQLS